MGTLDGLVDHVLDRLDDDGIGNRLLEVVSSRNRSAATSRRPAARAWPHWRRAEAELDVARLHELQDLRFLPSWAPGYWSISMVPLLSSLSLSAKMVPAMP